MGTLSDEYRESVRSRLGDIAFPYTSDLPVLQRTMVLERVGRRLEERSFPDSRIVQIIIEETRFVEACM